MRQALEFGAPVEFVHLMGHAVVGDGGLNTEVHQLDLRRRDGHDGGFVLHDFALGIEELNLHLMVARVGGGDAAEAAAYTVRMAFPDQRAVHIELRGD